MINQINGCLQNENTSVGQFLDRMQKMDYLRSAELRDVTRLQTGKYNYG